MAKMGRPKGATGRPQFHSYTNEVDRKAYVKWVKNNYKDDTALAKWYGDQLFGKATQRLEGDPDNPLISFFNQEQIDAIFSRRNKSSNSSSK